jgi:hypothetical protein
MPHKFLWIYAAPGFVFWQTVMKILAGTKKQLHWGNECDIMYKRSFERK